MSDVEELLRDSLNQHAGAAPPGYLMLSRVRQAARRRRRRRALAGGLAAALVLTGIGVAVFTGRVAAPPARLADGPGLGPAPVAFVPGAPLDITFPLTPGAPPPGGSSPALLVVAGSPTLRYQPGEGTDGPTTVTVTTSPPAPGPALPSTDLPGPVVGGHQAELRHPAGDPSQQVLTWSEAPDLWVDVTMPASAPPNSVTAFASALSVRPITQPGPFDFDLVPAGFVADNIDPSAVTFCPPGIEPSAAFVHKIAVMLDDGRPDARDGRPVTVAGRPGRIGTVDGSVMLRVDEGTGQTLTVQVPADLGIAEPELLRFAAGVHVTADAAPGKG